MCDVCNANEPVDEAEFIHKKVNKNNNNGIDYRYKSETKLLKCILFIEINRLCKTFSNVKKFNST